MTDRIRLDDLTDDALDALYERLEAAEETESQRQLAGAREAFASATVRAANLLADSHRRAEQAEAEVQRHITANLEAAERAQREIDRLREAVQRVMDLDAPDVAAAINPAYALGWKDALALARGVLDPAQRPAAATGSGAAVPDSSTAAGP